MAPCESPYSTNAILGEGLQTKKIISLNLERQYALL